MTNENSELTKSAPLAIEHLDFEVTCEARGGSDGACTQPARWRVRYMCPQCRRNKTAFACDTHKQRAITRLVLGQWFKCPRHKAVASELDGVERL